ncbi:bifunctional ADP-dependent NAD(P)H-hydrate dehydratase/NAD(P)H-hydrate epimerase [Halocynthiibacter namhaensis]|uniref:bifunctional ADP-dependent NAD(P)H-hydrate dehydratase/NAD(P)H-hydrate epimerase n=1 Tax=Halocynthiibacter namhaensis TaxID=1290553 RepID=UPI000579524B|nr:bifunctional ADP-dependent NAD(P)H-hydrate dehydratase/NAD(P)H-hydrate epimerase [Halocynthiibacter namhaensis]
MTELLTAAQMRAIEQAAIDRGEVTGLELMERAGAGVVEAIYEEWPEFSEKRNTPLKAIVLCGPGNNGGDGFVVARLLHARGWAVEVFLYGDAKKLPPDARVNYERWCEIAWVSQLTDADISEYNEDNPGTNLAIDAIFGTGCSRPFTSLGVAQQGLNYWAGASKNGEAPYMVSIDVPSGMCVDSGKWPGYEQVNPTHMCINANLTVTFHSFKHGHYLAYGGLSCGRSIVKDIGLENVTSEWFNHNESCQLIDKPCAISGCVVKSSGNKFCYGHALVLSGGPAQTGAARLAARGALRVGAGLVTLGVPPTAQQEVACQITAIMLKRVKDAETFSAILEDKRINALCLGPALGLGEREAELLDVALQSGRNCVLDADALTLLARGKALFDKLHPGCVLTPHGGEFARLFPDIAEKLDAPATTGPAYSKVDATREAAKRAGCTVLFKGADTVIADQNGRTAVNAAVYERSAPWLATAGSGDVLAGFITGLLARGGSPFDAAQSGAWLHVECALAFGPGLIAEDLPEQLPKVFKDLHP